MCASAANHHQLPFVRTVPPPRPPTNQPPSAHAAILQLTDPHPLDRPRPLTPGFSLPSTSPSLLLLSLARRWGPRRRTHLHHPTCNCSTQGMHGQGQLALRSNQGAHGQQCTQHSEVGMPHCNELAGRKLGPAQRALWLVRPLAGPVADALPAEDVAARGGSRACPC